MGGAPSAAAQFEAQTWSLEAPFQALLVGGIAESAGIYKAISVPTHIHRGKSSASAVARNATPNRGFRTGFEASNAASCNRGPSGRHRGRARRIRIAHRWIMITHRRLLTSGRMSTISHNSPML